MTVRPVSASTLLAVTAAGMTTTALIGPIVPDILADFGEPEHRAGLVVGLSTLPAIGFSPVLGSLADRYGRVQVLVPCTLAFAVLGGLSALAPSFEWLLLLRLLHGLPAAGLVVLSVVLISDQWTGNARARMLARNAALLTASLAVFPVVGGVVSDAFGWRAVFALYLFAAVPLLGLRARAVAPAGDVRVALGADLRATMGLLRIGRIGWASLASALVLAFVFGWNVTLLPVHAELVLGVSASVRGVLVGGGAALATLVALVYGGRAAVTRPEVVMFAACGIFIVGWMLVWAAGTSTVLVGVGIAVTGGAQGLVGPTLQNVIASDAPDEKRGAALSLWGSSVRLGQTVGPVLMAGALVITSTSGTYLIGVGLAAVCGAVLLPYVLRSSITSKESLS